MEWSFMPNTLYIYITDISSYHGKTSLLKGPHPNLIFQFSCIFSFNWNYLILKKANNMYNIEGIVSLTALINCNMSLIGSLMTLISYSVTVV